MNKTDDLEHQEFTLEDILKEFGSHPAPEEVPEEAAPDQAQETEPEPEASACSHPDAPLSDTAELPDLNHLKPADQTAPEPAAPIGEADPQPAAGDTTVLPDLKAAQAAGDTAVLPDLKAAQAAGDTAVLPDLKAAQALGDTVRLEDVRPALEDTQPLNQEDLAALRTSADDTVEFTPVSPEETPETEQPFSDNWEPEYEAPIGDYVPPQPIVFQPRSRLRELKRKLVAGPERRYYELMETGLSKLQAAIFLSFIVLLVASGALVLYGLGMVQPDRMRLLVFGEVLAMLLSALLGSYQLMRGLAGLFRRRITPDTVLSFTFLACCADSLLCLKNLRVPYCAAFCLEITLSLLAEYHRRNTEMGQMDTLRKAVRLNGVMQVPDFYEGRPGLVRSEGQLEDFMDHYARISKPETVLSRYMLIVLLAAIAVSVAVGVLTGWQNGVQCLTAALLSAVPGTCFVTISRPAAVLERKLHSVGAVLCGWEKTRQLCKSAVVPLNDQDLFPLGAVKMNGVKFFSQRDPDQVVAYAAALISADGGGLMPLFQQLLDSRNGRHYPVENFQIYPNGGLGGEVNGEPVLIGTHTFLHEMGVEIPDGTRVNQALYAAIDGELCGVFAVTYGKNRRSAAALSTLTSYRKLTPILTCSDFMLTEPFIKKKFGISTRRILFPASPVRRELAARVPDPETPSLALFTREDAASFAFTVTGARALRGSVNLGVTLHIIAGTLGLTVVAILGLIGYTHLLTPDHLMLFELLWMIPGFLITEWTRTV